VGPWLPAPLLTGPDASEAVLVDESVGSAMLLVMEELSPPERVAFILHDVFGIEFGRIADVLDTSGPAARTCFYRTTSGAASVSWNIIHGNSKDIT